MRSNEPPSQTPSEEGKPRHTLAPQINADERCAESATILLVEDEEMMRTLIGSLLESKGYSVITAGNGLEAVEQYKEHHSTISVVLTDIGLPKMSGWDAFREMKKIDRNVKVIFASGYIDPKLREDILADGGKHFIAKPYVPADLLKKLQETIETA